jgi:D-glycero-alpha-D-manno-heptose-7-phosphate kinase
VRAPVRALDAGGWTDTWFARTGAVCNLAMGDGVEAILECVEHADAARAATVELLVPAFGDRYEFVTDRLPGRHPLLEAVLRIYAPAGMKLTATVSSSVPPGAGLGTSASVVVALMTALNTLTAAAMDPTALARAAHEIETVDLGLESGVQDQIAAARGGCNLITIDSYPDTVVQSLDLTPATWDALTNRVVTVYLGAPHRSGELHAMVTERLANLDGEKLFAPLRETALRAARALLAADIATYGDAMIANTEAQAELHPALVSDRARNVIAQAARCRATGWKVNGAGGDGGTVTIIAREDPDEIVHALGSRPDLTILPLQPTRQGVRVNQDT